MPKSSKIQIGLVQTQRSQDIASNEAKSLQLIREATSKGAQVICLQELFKSVYFPQVEDKANFELAETVNEHNETVQKLMALAKELNIVIVGGSFFEKSDDRYFNTTVVVDADGRFLGKYRKMHIPEDPQFHEKFYFQDGDLDFQTFETKYANLGVLICWDQWFPEAARAVAQKGAQILIYPTAIGWLPHEKEALGDEQYQAWETIQRSHAIANGCFVASINRVGFEKHPQSEAKGIEFWGQSFVAGPLGQVIAKASENQEEILMTSINLDEIKETRREWPFFRDLKP